MRTTRSRFAASLVSGLLLALALNQVWRMEARWVIVTVTGLVFVSVSLICIRRFSDCLLLFLMLFIPLSAFTKWLFLDESDIVLKNFTVYSGALSIGITDFVLAGLYLTWFISIFVTREAPFPRPERADWLVLLLLTAACLSLMSKVPSPLMGLFALAHLIKYVAVYFYVSRNLQTYHIRWFVLSVFFAILLEAGIGLMQHHTGYLKGLMKDKGLGKVIEEPTVPGIENVDRATGTMLDSHTFGLYLALLLPYPFTYSFAPHIRWVKRLVSIFFFMLGGAVLAISYSRSAWLSAALSLCAALAILLFLGGRRVVEVALPALAILLILVVLAANTTMERFATAPKEIMTARYEQYKVAWDIWCRSPVFGCGAGNYLHVMRAYAGQDDEHDLVAHNVLLWIGAETGMLGVVAFFGLILTSLLRLRPVIVERHHPHCLVALSVSTGLIAYLLDGLTDPLFREPAVYMMFWFSIALSVALLRLRNQERTAGIVSC